MHRNRAMFGVAHPVPYFIYYHLLALIAAQKVNKCHDVILASTTRQRTLYKDGEFVVNIKNKQRTVTVEQLVKKISPFAFL